MSFFTVGIGTRRIGSIGSIRSSASVIEDGFPVALDRCHRIRLYSSKGGDRRGVGGDEFRLYTYSILAPFSLVLWFSAFIDGRPDKSIHLWVDVGKKHPELEILGINSFGSFTGPGAINLSKTKAKRFDPKRGSVLPSTLNTMEDLERWVTARKGELQEEKRSSPEGGSRKLFRKILVK